MAKIIKVTGCDNGTVETLIEKKLIVGLPVAEPESGYYVARYGVNKAELKKYKKAQESKESKR